MDEQNTLKKSRMVQTERISSNLSLMKLQVAGKLCVQGRGAGGGILRM